MLGVDLGVVAVTVVEQYVGAVGIAGQGGDLGCPFADLIADTRLLRMSKRKADLDIIVTSVQVPEGPVAHATATFSPRPATTHT